jgi:hypothetical protein
MLAVRLYVAILTRDVVIPGVMNEIGFLVFNKKLFLIYRLLVKP